MAELSPRLLERRRRREARERPWRDAKLPLSLSITSKYALPNTPTKQKPYQRRADLSRTLRRSPQRIESEPKEPFPFLRLPYDVQLLVGEYLVGSLQPLKCEEFISKDEKSDGDVKVAPPKHELSPEGHPVWIPLIQVCPWLGKDLSRVWYRENTFFLKSVADWNAFVGRATWNNASRISHLHVDNEFIYCSGKSVNEDAEWRSHMILSPMKSLRTLTLYRDDGGPGSYTQGGHDEFNSVDWFVRFAMDCASLHKIKFALYPWSGFEPYPMADSNMVAWIKDWEHEWDGVMVQRRPKEAKGTLSWYPENSPIVICPAPTRQNTTTSQSQG